MSWKSFTPFVALPYSQTYRAVATQATRIGNIFFSVAVLAVLMTAKANADPVGDIRVCYFCTTDFGFGKIIDAPTFIIENTSATAISGGVLSIGPIGGTDSFAVGTILAGGTAYVIPGLSNDGGVHGGGFFTHTGSGLDTSDVGPDGDNVEFEFTGMQGIVQLDTGVFTPAATAGASNDASVADLNFLGGPAGADGPCNDCFGPKVVATISTADTTGLVPEPATLLLFGSVALGALVRRRKR
jgi:hypothetical protein